MPCGFSRNEEPDGSTIECFVRCLTWHRDRTGPACRVEAPFDEAVAVDECDAPVAEATLQGRHHERLRRLVFREEQYLLPAKALRDHAHDPADFRFLNHCIRGL